MVRAARPLRKQRSLRADLADRLDQEGHDRVVGATLLLDLAVERFLADLLPLEEGTAVRRPG